MNIIGSLFYGGLLGVFVLAFFFKSVGANGAFCGVLAGEAAIFAANLFTKISFLWYNVIGCLVVVVVGVIVSRIFDHERKTGGGDSMTEQIKTLFGKTNQYSSVRPGPPFRRPCGANAAAIFVSEENDLGYVSMCPFAPWSTLSLLLVAG